MILVVTNDPKIINTTIYKVISVEESLLLLWELPILQYDSETTGLNPHIANIICIQFGNKEKDIQIVVDANTVDLKLYKQILESKYLIGHNLKFDLQFLFTIGITPKNVYDTMIVEQFIYLGYPPGKIKFGLAPVANRYLGIEIDKEIRAQLNIRGLDDAVVFYSANDVVHLEDIMAYQIALCKQRECIIGAKVECDFVPAIAYLEWCGIKLDESKWKVKMDKDKANMDSYRVLLDDFIVALGNPDFIHLDPQGDLFSGFQEKPTCLINWNAPQQVVELAQFLGFDTKTADKKTGEDKDSVVEKVLKGQKGINDEFLDLYFKYKEYSKVVGTYGQKYLDAINPITGRIHTVFRQLGTASGRLSCGSSKTKDKELANLKGISADRCGYVQLQNLPADHDTRESFVAPKGALMCSCDYSAMESRLGADIYNEQSMIDEYMYGSGDMHSLVAKMCFGSELEGIDVKDIKKLRPDLRKRAKAPEFACQFGGGANAIQGSLMCSKEEAQRIENAYFEGFSGIADFKKTGTEFVHKNGYVLMCKHTGHRMTWHDHEYWLSVKDMFNKEFWEEYRSLKETDPEHPKVLMVKHHFKAASKWSRMALNAVTQGSGAIIGKIAMAMMYSWIIENNLFNKVKISNYVHDEICIDYPENHPECSEVLKEIMEKAADMICKKLPIPAAPEVGTFWIH